MGRKDRSENRTKRGKKRVAVRREIIGGGEFR